MHLQNGNCHIHRTKWKKEHGPSRRLSHLGTRGARRNMFGVRVSRESHSLVNISIFSQLREVGVIRRRRRRRRMTQTSRSCENFGIFSSECGFILFTCFKIFLRAPRVPGHSTQIKSEKEKKSPIKAVLPIQRISAFQIFIFPPHESVHWDKSHQGDCPIPGDTSHQGECSNLVD